MSVPLLCQWLMILYECILYMNIYVFMCMYICIIYVWYVFYMCVYAYIYICIFAYEYIHMYFHIDLLYTLSPMPIKFFLKSDSHVIHYCK